MFSWVILTLDQVRKLSQCIVLTDKKMYWWKYDFAEILLGVGHLVKTTKLTFPIRCFAKESFICCSMTFCNSIWINSTTEWKTIHTICATTFIWPTWKVLLIITKCLWTQYSISLIPTWTGACRHALFTVTCRTLQTKSLYFTSMIADIILTLESLLVIPPTHLADILPAKSNKSDPLLYSRYNNA